MVRRTLQLIIALLLTSAVANAGGTIFGGNGLGEAQILGGARTAGLAGGGLALQDSIGFNGQNPALAAFARGALFRMSGKFAVWSVDAEGQTDTDGELTWNDLHLYLPVTGRYVAGLGVEPSRRADAKTFRNRETTFEGTDSIEIYEERLVWNGGTTDLKLDNAYRVNDDLSFGLTVAYSFTNLNRNVILDFDVARPSDSTLYRDLAYYATARFKGWWTKLGMSWKPAAKLGIGAYYRPRTGGNWELVESENDGSATVTTKRDGDVPSAYGAGVAYMPTGRLILTADVQAEQWERRDLGILFDDVEGLEVSNPLFVSVGLEHLENHTRVGGGLDEWGYRGGFFYRQHYWTAANGDAVTDLGVSLGTSIPVGGWTGRLHLAGELGQRGSDSIGATETFVRVQVQLEMNEKWFQRAKPRIPK